MPHRSQIKTAAENYSENCTSANFPLFAYREAEFGARHLRSELFRPSPLTRRTRRNACLPNLTTSQRYREEGISAVGFRSGANESDFKRYGKRSCLDLTRRTSNRDRLHGCARTVIILIPGSV